MLFDTYNAPSPVISRGEVKDGGGSSSIRNERDGKSAWENRCWLLILKVGGVWDTPYFLHKMKGYGMKLELILLYAVLLRDGSC